MKILYTKTVTGMDVASIIAKNKSQLYAAMKELVDIGEKEAKAVMEAKRKYPAKGGSPLIESFAVLTTMTDTITGYVMCGGRGAPYAYWVEVGHKTPSGNWVDGKEFMLAGMNKMVEVAPSVIQKHLK